MELSYVCTQSANMGDIDSNNTEMGYSGVRFRISVDTQRSGTQIFYLFIWGFTSLLTLYRSYHKG